MRISDAQEPKYLHIYAGLFIAVLLVSNILAQKLFTFGPTVFTAGIIIFPISYILGDVLTEVYGYARTRRVIWMGFIASVFMVAAIKLAVLLPPAETWPLQNEFEAVFKQVPRIVVASLLAYLAGEFVNSYVMAKLKVITNGKRLWMRTIGSTILGQGVDTFVFALVAFVGIMPLSTIFAITFWGYLFKVAYETLATPLTYVIVNWTKKIEGIDVFDTETSFTPFSLKS